MSHGKNSPRGKATPDERRRPTDRDADADTLTMPQEHGPAGNGYMWSGAVGRGRCARRRRRVSRVRASPLLVAGPTVFGTGRQG